MLTVSSLTPRQQVEAVHRAERTLYERRLLEFTRAAWEVVEPQNPFVDSWHCGCICEHLQAVTAGEIIRLVINCPPRCSKSYLISVMWFAWVWAKQPHTRWIYGSYGGDLVERDSAYSRDLIKSDWYQRYWPHVQIRDDDDSRGSFKSTRKGSRMAVTVSGARSTGFGTDYLIADDPLKAQDAKRSFKLDEAIHWWTKAMSTRGNMAASMRRVVAHQRLGPRDLSGYVMAEKLGYQALVLPMTYDPARYLLPDTDPDKIKPTTLQERRPDLMDGSPESGRSVENPLLFKERIPPAAVAEWQKVLGEEADLQLEQKGSAATGTLFRREFIRTFRRCLLRGAEAVRLEKEGGSYEIFPLSALRFFQTIDTAMSEKKRADWSVVLTAGLTPRFDLLIWHSWRLRLQVPEQFEMVRRAREAPHEYVSATHGFHPVGSWPFRILMQAVESKGSGIGLLQEAASKGLDLHELKADKDKVTRTSPLLGMMRRGKVYFQTDGEWFPALLSEMMEFPTGAFDDQVDALSYAGFLAIHDEILRSAVEGYVPLGADLEDDPTRTQVEVGEDADGNALMLDIDWRDD